MHTDRLLSTKIITTYAEPHTNTNELYSHAPHKGVLINDGSHIRRWSHKIIT